MDEGESKEASRSIPENIEPVSDVVAPSPEDRERLIYIVETLAGSLDYDGVKKWLASYSTLDEAFEAARQLRDGMIAT